MATSPGSLNIPSIKSSSLTSLAHPQSIRSQTASARYPSIRTVVTSPPWANDEPPSPTSDDDDTVVHRRPSDARPSDVASYQSSGPPGSSTENRWWTFARPRGTVGPPPVFDVQEEGTSQDAQKPEKRGIMFRERSKAWLPTSRRSQDLHPKQPGFDTHRSAHNDNQPNAWGLTIDLPPPPSTPFTMQQSATPGWNSPWTPRAPRHTFTQDEEMFGRESDEEKESSWKKRLRTFILTNTFVPLLFRFINITFTTAALGIAIRIRLTEMRHNITGVVGSSPTLVIIFAPLTLVHVMVAIYMEYFGRPLGLWHTSSKLTHTLGEVLFICAWSAALSLCFDNYATSLVPCTGPSSVEWYSEIPRPTSSLGNLGSVGDRICDDQVVLMIVVFVGLITYCINLNISLFRIFEKVKYHPGSFRGLG